MWICAMPLFTRYSCEKLRLYSMLYFVRAKRSSSRRAEESFHVLWLRERMAVSKWNHRHFLPATFVLDLWKAWGHLSPTKPPEINRKRGKGGYWYKKNKKAQDRNRQSVPEKQKNTLNKDENFRQKPEADPFARRAELPWAYNRFCVCTLFCGISFSFHALRRCSQLQDIKRTVCYRHDTITYSSKCWKKSRITRSRRDSRDIYWFKQVVNRSRWVKVNLKLNCLWTEVGNRS